MLDGDGRATEVEGGMEIRILLEKGVRLDGRLSVGLLGADKETRER